MAEIEKGKISTVEGPADGNGNSTRARVVPDQADGVITKPLVIPALLRGDAGKLVKGTEVVFAVFPDQTGIILGRADGEWYGVLYGNIRVSKDIETETVKSVNYHKHGGIYPGSGATDIPQG